MMSRLLCLYLSVSTLTGSRMTSGLCYTPLCLSLDMGTINGVADILGPVVQSVVSLTSSLRVISLTILAHSIYNILIFFAEKM